VEKSKNEEFASLIKDVFKEETASLERFLVITTMLLGLPD